jgi:hypothetical protein
VTLGGRQWLWHNPDLPFEIPEPGASFAKTVPSGGCDECFPTIAPCKLPAWVTGASGAKLAERGALWSQRLEMSIGTGDGGNTATCRWSVSPVPFLFTRTVTVRADGAVEFAYSATNAGERRLPFLWAAQPVFPLTRQTRLVLPTGARTRVWMQQGIRLGDGLALHAWPRVRSEATVLDFTRPDSVLRTPFACTLFVELPRKENVIAIEEGKHRLEMQVHGREVSHVGIWINRDALGAAERKEPKFRWAKPKRCATITFAPCMGAPESLVDALSVWETARWIEPESTARWGMTWMGREVSREPESGVKQ